MQDLIKDFLKQKHFAIVGSFRHEQKFAYQILKSLRDRGHEVYLVNARFKKIEDLACYPSVMDIPVVCDVANIITPPEVTVNIVKECKNKGIKRIWLQPGAENENVIEFCKQNNLKVIYNICVMLEKI